MTPHIPSGHDVTALILDEHERFRKLFARLDNSQDDAAAIWRELSTLLDAHAAAEEQSFYPALLKAAHDDDQVRDAIKDHNDIRDAVRDANAQNTGSDGWREAVARARKANSDHMAEEERGPLAVARQRLSDEQRSTLAEAFVRARDAFRSGAMEDTQDKDPQAYVREHEAGN